MNGGKTGTCTYVENTDSRTITLSLLNNRRIVSNDNGFIKVLVIK